MYGVFKKAVLAGLGVRAKLNDVVDDLVKKGEGAQDKPSADVREFVASCEQSARGVERFVKEGLGAVAKAVRTPGRSDLDAIERQLRELSQKVDAMSRNSAANR
jgi:polyhydroxyalkanoate synthesis regulator phasin